MLELLARAQVDGVLLPQCGPGGDPAQGGGHDELGERCSVSARVSSALTVSSSMMPLRRSRRRMRAWAICRMSATSPLVRQGSGWT